MLNVQNSTIQKVKLSLMLACVASLTMMACGANGESSDVAKSSEATTASKATKTYGPPLDFRGTISGDLLDLSPKEGEVITDQAKQFLATGENPYRGNADEIKKGYTIFSTACSGCHGHLAEGKLGPALADDYWTYPKNETDKGLFETIYGGAAGMMGPQKGLLKIDEIMHVMAWLRFQRDENAKGNQSH